MNILLANPPMSYLYMSSLMYPHMPAVNLMMLASMVRGDHEVRILNNDRCRLRSHMMRRMLRSFSPDLFGFSFHSVSNTSSIFDLVGELKSGKHKGATYVAGGGYATQNPKEVLQAGFDYVVLGEGEVTFRELTDHLVSCPDEPPGKIPGLAFLEEEGGTVVETEKRPLVEDLDTLPFPSIDLESDKKRLFTRRDFAFIETQRGCPYECVFCEIRSFWDGTFREKSNERILEEMAFLKHRGIGEILFIDNSFGINVRKTEALLEAMIRAGFGFVWSAMFRPDTVANNPDMIRLARRAGLIYTIIGFEAYRQDSLDRMKKGTAVEDNYRASEILRRNDVVMFGTHMFGLPWEGREDILNTYREGIRTSDIFRSSIFVPIHGSTIFHSLRSEEKLLTEDPDRYDYVTHTIDTSLSNMEVRRLGIRLALRYYGHPSRMLKMVLPRNFVMRSIFRMAYKSVFLSGLYLLLRKIGLRIM